MPDFANLTIGQIAGYIVSIAVLVWITGVGKALASTTVLWTYVAGWLSDWLGKGGVLLALAIVGKGIPGITEKNDLVQIIFIPAAAAYVIAALAAIAKNVGVDIGNLPFASKAEAVFGPQAVRSKVTPAVTSSSDTKL